MPLQTRRAPPRLPFPGKIFPVIIVFDTTVLHRDVHASRTLMRDVLRGAAAGDWTVVVPGVVVEEAVRQYPDRLKASIRAVRRDLSTHRSDLQALGLPVPEFPLLDDDALIAAYEADMRATLSGDGCEIADAPGETELVGEWAATRRSPFKEDGRGVADAFVWLTVIERATEDEVILVSANSRDFGDPDDPTKLAPALLEDLDDRGIAAERVRRVDTIHQLLVELRTPAQQALEAARAILEDPARKAALIAAISFQASWTLGRFDAIEDWNLGVPVEEFSLRAFDSGSLELESADLLDGRLVMFLAAEGQGSFEFFVEKSEIIHAPDDSPVEVYDDDWNERYVWADATISARAHLDVRSDIAAAKSDDFEVSIEDLEPA